MRRGLGIIDSGWRRQGRARAGRPRSFAGRQARAPRDESASKGQRARLILLVVGVASGLLAIFGRCAHLQVIRAPELLDQARSQQERTITLDPLRGPILDRNGKELAVSVDVDSVFAEPGAVDDPASSARRLAPVVDVPASELRERLASDRHFVWVKRKITPELRRRIEALKIAGVGFVRESRRYYPKRALAAHVIGACGMDNQGLAGLEFMYDGAIRGTPGQMVALRDGRGGRVLDREKKEPAPGFGLRLTVDEVIQYDVERALDESMRETRAEGATVVVMRPQTGEVLALASRPVFDPNAYSDARETSRRNRATSDYYEPGSTFKVVTMGAALTAGIVTPQTQFRIPYAIKVGDRIVHDDAVRPTRTFTAAQILQQSSNVGTVTIAELVHKQPLYDWIRRWGFGRRTDIGLPAEAAGAVMPPDKWYSSSIGNIPIGQGISVTPLQMAAMYAGIANGGVMVEPHVVEKIGGRPAPKPVSRRVLSPTVDHTLVNMLKGVVDTAAGTGTRASVPGYTVAGKTGTAQKALPHSLGYSTRNYVASFVGFLPADNPRVEVLVVVDSPRTNIFGGIVAAPAFQQIATFLTKDLAIPPDKPLDLPVN